MRAIFTAVDGLHKVTRLPSIVPLVTTIFQGVRRHYRYAGTHSGIPRYIEDPNHAQTDHAAIRQGLEKRIENQRSSLRSMFNLKEKYRQDGIEMRSEVQSHVEQNRKLIDGYISQAQEITALKDETERLREERTFLRNDRKKMHKRLTFLRKTVDRYVTIFGPIMRSF